MAKPVDVAVIDYGMGNLHSVSKALQHVDPSATVWVGSDPEVIRNASRIVYPGVGAIRDCMGELKARGLDQTILEVAQTKPLLAICVGMQGLMARSDENNGVDCLGLFSNQVEFFSKDIVGSRDDSNKRPAGAAIGKETSTETVAEKKDSSVLKVPHMGWNQVEQCMAHPLWDKIENFARFYFVHSYFVAAHNNSHVAGVTDYGTRIAAAMAHKNMFAVQFHPEKSHKDGLQLLSNFMRWDGSH